MKKRSEKKINGFREAYKRTRKPGAPAEKIIPDKRQKILEAVLEREAVPPHADLSPRDTAAARAERGAADFARARIFVSGKVQGVFFRAAATEKAGSLGLTGWVRNRSDGRVEILAEGPKDALRTLIDWSHEGPPAAVVADAEVFWEDGTGEFASFEQAHTI